MILQIQIGALELNVWWSIVKKGMCFPYLPGAHIEMRTSYRSAAKGKMQPIKTFMQWKNNTMKGGIKKWGSTCIRAQPSIDGLICAGMS
jgi:hypothetical protein